MVIILCCLPPKNWAGQVEHLGQFSISRSLQSGSIFDQRQQTGSDREIDTSAEKPKKRRTTTVTTWRPIKIKRHSLAARSGFYV
jgi:hypothetical protein